MSELQQQLTKALTGKSPLLYLLTNEETRIRRLLSQLAGDRPIHAWSCVQGLDGDSSLARPAEALKAVLESSSPDIYLFCDLAPFLEQPEVARALREIAADSACDRQIYVISPELLLPEALKQEFTLLEIAPPDEEEIAELVSAFQQEHPGLAIAPEELRNVHLALKGLTESEILLVLANCLASRQQGGTEHAESLLDDIFLAKKNSVRKSGFLEFAPPRWKIGDLGGLDNLKDWLTRREKMFTREALAAGVPIPKGLLIMGVSGCGKSLAVKTISSLWNIPMFRLDMNLVFSGMYGTPEAAFHRAMKTVEAVAPAVLWIDEIENALGLDESGQRISSHIFSSFLTWMQEKPPLVFIAATANRIQALPAEILRKGRFDEVFFCDLPATQERADIFRIHLLRNGANPDDFDFKMLQVLTEGWNGAEIEQAVISARTEAFYEGRPFGQRDLSNVISRIVPLSDTMEQQIKAIRSWAFSRATPASKFGKSASRRS